MPSGVLKSGNYDDKQPFIIAIFTTNCDFVLKYAILRQLHTLLITNDLYFIYT